MKLWEHFGSHIWGAADDGILYYESSFISLHVHFAFGLAFIFRISLFFSFHTSIILFSQETVYPTSLHLGLFYYRVYWNQLEYYYLFSQGLPSKVSIGFTTSDNLTITAESTISIYSIPTSRLITSIESRRKWREDSTLSQMKNCPSAPST